MCLSTRGLPSVRVCLQRGVCPLWGSGFSGGFALCEGLPSAGGSALCEGLPSVVGLPSVRVCLQRGVCPLWWSACSGGVCLLRGQGLHPRGVCLLRTGGSAFMGGSAFSGGSTAFRVSEGGGGDWGCLQRRASAFWGIRVCIWGEGSAFWQGGLPLRGGVCLLRGICLPKTLSP